MLKDKTAIVTGASRGIGAAIAKKLAGEGAKVAVIYAGNAAAAEDVCSQIAAAGGTARAWQLNVADFAACQSTVKDIHEAFATIDILVNNAGINRDGLIARMKEEDFDDVIATNLKGAFNMIRHAGAVMMRQRAGRIINISSVAGLMGNAGQANYAASKAGLIGLTKSVARELAPRGVTCNAIAPGFIQTDMTRDFDETNPFVASIPLKRMGTPGEIAELAAFLSGDGAGYITGEVIRMDGGLAM